MRWRDRRQSDNIEDRRGMSGGGKLALGGLGGCGTIVVLLLALLFGADPRQLFEQLPTTGGGGAPTTTRPTNPQEEELKQFVAVVLAETEDAWTNTFRQIGRTYRKPTLVLFTDQVESACGVAGAAVGPFYCPGDEKLYIDLSFFHELRTKLGAPGDFAIAYVVAHEVGHHVQKLLGTMDQVNSSRRRLSEGQANQLSVRLELQADFYAGLWAHHARNQGIVQEGDIEEALGAASAVGDDRLQNQGQGYVVPDSFTHGTSEQRARWFRKGFDTGDVRAGDTFAGGL
jgi:predicted metalloprotease